MTEQEVKNEPNCKMCFNCAMLFPLSEFLSKTNKVLNRCVSCRNRINKNEKTYLKRQREKFEEESKNENNTNSKPIKKSNYVKRSKTYCDLCNHNFFSSRYEEHLQSIKHKVNLYKQNNSIPEPTFHNEVK